MDEGVKGPIPKICHANPTMMKLSTVITLPKKFLLTSAFFTGNYQLLLGLYQEIQI